MQRLVNGVAQQVLGSCRCPQCVPGHAGNAARRFGARSMNARPRYMISSTFWLSGIFASAATFDAGQKIRRRDQWDQAIADIKDDLEMTSRAESPKQEKITATRIEKEKVTTTRIEKEKELQQWAEFDPMFGFEEVSRETAAVPTEQEHDQRQHPPLAAYKPFVAAELQPEELQSAQHLQNTILEEPMTNTAADRASNEHLRKQRIKWYTVMRKSKEYDIHLVNPAITLLDQIHETERWSVNTGDELKQHTLAPESIYLTESFLTHQRHTWTPKKAEVINIATNMLQLEMLKCLSFHDRHTDATAFPEAAQQMLRISSSAVEHECQILKKDLHKAWRCPEDLRDYRRSFRSIPLPAYRSQDGTADTEPRITNQQLYDAFRRTSTTSDIASSVATLANVLDILNSAQLPPNLHTYNLLIAGLSDCGLRGMANFAIQALRRCQLRPNEATVSTVLQHCTKYDDWVQFERWIDIVAGKHGGLALANPVRVEYGPRSPLLLSNEVEPYKTLQLQSKNPKVFSAIIAGSTRFWGIDEALKRCRSMGKKGWGLDMNALGALLRDCARRKDFEVGTQLWSLVCRLEAQTKRIDSASGQEARLVPKHVFAAMLELCQRAGHDKQYSQVADHARTVWPTAFASILNLNKMTATWIESQAPSFSKWLEVKKLPRDYKKASDWRDDVVNMSMRNRPAAALPQEIVKVKDDNQQNQQPPIELLKLHDYAAEVHDEMFTTEDVSEAHIKKPKKKQIEKEVKGTPSQQHHRPTKLTSWQDTGQQFQLLPPSRSYEQHMSL